MFEQIIALPQPHPAWTCDGAGASPVTLIAFRERCGEIEYLAQSWREDGEMYTGWIAGVLTEDAARARAAIFARSVTAGARANWGRSRTTTTGSAA